jgi:hypothetical protein
LNPVFGAARISRFFFGLLRKYPNKYRSRMIRANGQPHVGYLGNAPVSIGALFDGNRITALHLTGTPEKLASFCTDMQTVEQAPS